MKYSNIGGQAVMEGIMMKNGDHYAVAVRKPDKEIEVKVEECHSFIKNKKILQLPFIRGVFNFVDSLVLGMTRKRKKSGRRKKNSAKRAKIQKKKIPSFWDLPLLFLLSWLWACL